MRTCTCIAPFALLLISTAIAQQSPTPQETKAASDAVNTFGTRLLSDLASQRPHENVFVSPLSVFAALAMTESGSGGQTREAMRQAMAVPAALSEDELHRSASAMLKSLNAQKGVELAIANALWADVKSPLAPGFIQQCLRLYDAHATTLNFEQPSAAGIINSWVSRNTRGKIPSIVDPSIVRSSTAILTNAVYFKGKWDLPFPKDQTQNRPFHLADGKQKQAPFMHLSSIRGAYRSGQGFEAAALRYEGSSTITFYAILPAPGMSPEDVLKKMQVQDLFRPQSNELDLRLPRFTLDFKASLKDALEQMGMSLAFQNAADFKLMSPRPFKIGDVLHKTRLEVDEQGTVAAAATGITMMATAARSPEPKKVLVFDRPFALLLCDPQTGAILFAGVIYKP